jgi:uncharacterized protein (TIGR03435 family)
MGDRLSCMKRLALFLSVAAAVLSVAQTPALPTFDVASIRPTKPGTQNANLSTAPGRLTVHNMAVMGLIRFAYNVDGFQISGAPGWFRTERYDILAKADSPVGDDKIKLMLQALLAERFKLALHRETKEGTTYALVVSKSGSKIKEAKSDDGSNLQQDSGGSLSAKAVTMSMWAHDLERLTGRLVADETGLKGFYDFTFTWSPMQNQPMNEKEASTPVDATGPTIFTALQEQLGLKLESRKGQIESLVIDHAEKATEN